MARKLRPPKRSFHARQMAVEAVEVGNVSYEPHFAKERSHRQITLQEIARVILDPESSIIEGDLKEYRGARSFAMIGESERGILVVAFMFYLPEDAEIPDTLSIITAYYKDE